MLKGIGVATGFGSAPAIRYIVEEIKIPAHQCASIEKEIQLFLNARDTVKENNKNYCKAAMLRTGAQEAAIFEAHIMMLEDDDSLIIPITDAIREGKNAAAAVDCIFSVLIEMMLSAQDELLAQRAADFKDLRDQLLEVILDIKKIDLSNLETDSVIICKELAPSDTIRMDIGHISGIVCEEGGVTSHTAIIAKAMGLPAIVACKGILSQAKDQDLIQMDSGSGEVWINPSAEEKASFFLKVEAFQEENQALQKYKDRKSLTKDGKQVSICANIAQPDECAFAVDCGCEGVGLFRSEFLYIDKDCLPSEAEQFEAYKKALELAQGRPVTIRTLDAGGDKKMPLLTNSKEENPFLGYRAIRICLDNPEMFKAQLRALLRASVYGNLRIMFPMISSFEELYHAKAILNEVKDELRNESIPFDEDVQVGMMIEIPSTAVMADEFAKEVDFFSIGTNDLVQYTLAVDRGNPQIARLYSHYHPAVFRLIKMTIEAAHRNGIYCCMCGEAAGDLEFIPVLLGLGLDSFSMSAPTILKARKLMEGLSSIDCEALCQQLLTARSIGEMKVMVDEAIKI